MPVTVEEYDEYLKEIELIKTKFNDFFLDQLDKEKNITEEEKKILFSDILFFWWSINPLADPKIGLNFVSGGIADFCDENEKYLRIAMKNEFRGQLDIIKEITDRAVDKMHKFRTEHGFY